MHGLLKRQLRKYLGRTEGFSDELDGLIGAIDEAYHQNDEDRAMLEHSMELSSRELMGRNDELIASNQMLQRSLDRLEELQVELVETSRRAGMADVATSVLHNVGNVLNSINVSAGLVSDLTRRARITGLSKVLDLLRSGRESAQGFLIEDERGRRVPEYLDLIIESTRRNQQTVLAELETLQRNVDHIKIIIAMQQAHARPVGVIETLPIAAVIDEALNINQGHSRQNHVELIRVIHAPVEVTTEKHRVLQILINLLSNAWQAIAEQRVERPVVTVRTHSPAPGRVAIDVEDNGVGISAEHLTSIFGSGSPRDATVTASASTAAPARRSSSAEPSPRGATAPGEAPASPSNSPRSTRPRRRGPDRRRGLLTGGAASFAVAVSQPIALRRRGFSDTSEALSDEVAPGASPGRASGSTPPPPRRRSFPRRGGRRSARRTPRALARRGATRRRSPTRARGRC